MSDMPREAVERLMRESGMSFHLGMPHEAVIKQMTRFATMLRDEILEASEHSIQCAMEFEREECAKVCDSLEEQCEKLLVPDEKWPTPADCAAIIRARSKA